MASLDVDVALVRLGLNQDGTLEVPSRYDDVGWYERGPRPGERGAAVVAAHYDSTDGPAAFYRLGELQAGHFIEFEQTDGGTVRFVVDRVEQHPKDRFPSKRVYGPTSGPEVRLITCGGTFDRSSRHYRDNLIVFGHLAAGAAATPAPR